MIRDRIVVGLLNAKLAEKLQLQADLTLVKAVNEARQSEQVKKQQALMRNDFTESASKSDQEVDAVNYKARKNYKSTDSNKSQCPRCGKSPSHGRFMFPAKDSVCHKCSGKGHWKAVCKAKHVSEVEEIANGANDIFLGVIGNDTDNNSWTVTANVNGSPVCFKLDTGADMSIISDEVYQSLQPLPKLLESEKNLYGAAHTKLNVRGYFKANLEHGDRMSEQEVFVVSGARCALLGRPAIESLNLVEVVNSVETGRDYMAKFPQLFTGLGKLKGPDCVI